MNLDSHTHEWKELLSAPAYQRINAVLKYVNSYVQKKENGEVRAEQAGYAVCGIMGAEFKDLPKDIEELIDAACELEIGRESTYFYGEGEWNQNVADLKKEEQWDRFNDLFLELRNKYLS
jgi:hypothetical protein